MEETVASPTETNPLSDTDHESTRNQSVRSTDDIPQLEYDECDIQLIADREIDDEDLDYEIMMGSMTSPGANIGNITSDGIIDDDFETELAGSQNTEIHESDDPDHHLIEKISEYGIVEVYDDDKFGRKMIVFSACRLPHQILIQTSEFKTMPKFYNCLLKYIFQTFDQYVDTDYVIVYFHRGLHSYNRPSYGWLLQAYKSLQRKYKKNLKALYIVHPTTWIKFLWPILRSFISAKFSSKLIYINRLGQLTEYVHLTNLKIPTEVKNYDPIIPIEIPPIQLRPTMKFHVPLKFILDHEPGEKVPMIVQQTIDFIKNYGLNEPGILRQSAPIKSVKYVQDRYNAGQPVVFAPHNDLHLAACILKIFLRDLTEPLFTFRLYPEILSLASGLKRAEQLDAIRDFINDSLPDENYHVLKYLIDFFHLISVYSDTNLLTTGNLALIFGLILARSDDLNANNMSNISLINIFIEYLIIHYTEIFLH